MHLAMEFSTTYHFADDTNMLYSCKSLEHMREKMNKDLAFLFEWLCANRLSLNAGKTEFIIFRPPRYKSRERVTLKLHHSKLFESSKVKYLGIILDNKLNWKNHIIELSKKLSRAVGLIHKIKKYCPSTVLRSLYFSLFNCHLSYGLIVWGNANNLYLDKIRSLQRRALKLISTIEDIDIDKIHLNSKIFSLDHQLRLQFSSLMWDYDHDILPPSLNVYFTKVNQIHNYSTRAASKGSLFYDKINTTTFGIRSFKYQGLKVFNDMLSMDGYQNIKNKNLFMKKIKNELLSTYAAT